MAERSIYRVLCLESGTVGGRSQVLFSSLLAPGDAKHWGLNLWGHSQPVVKVVVVNQHHTGHVPQPF